jgi:hypothetical protein
MSITGQIIVRDVGEVHNPSVKKLAGKGRKLVMVFGILAIPENSELKGEHQYPVFGDNSNVVRIAEEQCEAIHQAAQ